MYSRADRKFLTPDADHSNPILGPGSYSPENMSGSWGKLGRKPIGYAPFASLSPRVSFFDSIVPGPAPGTYDSLTLPLKKADKAPYFGRSKATRFDAKAVDTPGPGSYVLPSSLHLKKSGKNKAASGLISTIQEHPLTRQPIQIAASRSLNVLPEGGSAPDLRQQHSSHGPVVIASPLAAPSDSSSYPPVESVTLNAQSDPKLLGPTAERLKYSNRRMPGVSSAPSDSHSSSHPPKSKAKIIWKRKHLPPSIPMGNFSFGYSENSEGNLVPRKAPRRSAQIEPAYLTSFAEQAKHYNRGHRFGQSEGRLQFKANPGPGPLEYNPSQSDEYLKQSRRGHAVMALSPCKRLTDEIVNEAVKKGVPGPGAYEVKIINESSKKRLNGTMGGEGHKGYLESTQMFSPGPGAYYPEQAERSKPANVKCSTFGSTKKRFDHDKLKYLSETIPAPGSYDLDEINSLAKTVQKRVHVSSTNPAIAFGSFTERFKHQRPQTSTEPGPAAYDLTNSQLEYEVKNGSSKALTTNEIANRRSKERESKLVSLLRRGPRQYQIGNMLIAATQVHIPVFGTQTERFPSNVDKDIPPPGTYEIEEAFKNLKTKGKLEKTSTLSSLAKRELFKVTESIPGPGEYNPAMPKKSELIVNQSFISSEPRFVGKTEDLPGPGAYTSQESSSLVKKSFNVSLA